MKFREGDIVFYKNEIYEVCRTGKTWIHDHEFVKLRRADWTYSINSETVMAENFAEIKLLISKKLIWGFTQNDYVVQYEVNIPKEWERTKK